MFFYNALKTYFFFISSTGYGYENKRTLFWKLIPK